MRSTIMIATTCAFLTARIPPAHARHSLSRSAASPDGNSSRSSKNSRRPARSGALQGHRQRPDAIRRSPRGNGSQSQRHRLDRSPTQKLWLHEHRTPQVRLSTALFQIAQHDSKHRGRSGHANSAGATSVGGGRPRGLRVRTGVNVDPNAQPDAKLRALDSQPPRRVPAKKSTAQKSAPRIPTKCTSLAPTWTASAGAKPRMTMDRAPLW